jgi:FkbM family methyltransferase
MIAARSIILSPSRGEAPNNTMEASTKSAQHRQTNRRPLESARMLLSLFRALVSMSLSGRLPTRRAIATLAKLCGRRLERRWPFLPKATGKHLNLGIDDLLEFQYARRRNFLALSVGAFDGVVNDPSGEFIRARRCRAIFVEPQPAAFARLCGNLSGFENIVLVNAAIDEVTGVRDFYCIPPGIDALPAWTEQLASFSREHLLRHEDGAPGLSRYIVTLKVSTFSFTDLLDKYGVRSLDVLQIDAEGMDAQLLAWFPFERVKPAVLHYETAHMSAEEHRLVRNRLEDLGYKVRQSDSPTDDMAILF